MYNFLIGVELAIAILLILVVVLQPTKTSSASTAFMGGSKEAVQTSRPRGFEAFLSKATKFLGAAFMIIAVVIAMIR